MDQAERLATCAESLDRQIWDEGPDELSALEGPLSTQLADAGLSLPEVLRELSDESLALAVQKGFLGSETFTELFVTRYGPYLARWLFRWGTESHQALDLIQQLYVKFYERRLASYRGNQNFRAYLRRAVYHLWVQKVWRPKRVGSLDEDGDVPAAGPGPEQALLDREAAERIDQALQQLRPREQNVVRETMNGKSADEIAHSLGLKKSQVFASLFRGRRRLEQLLHLPPRKKPSSDSPLAPDEPAQDDNPLDNPLGLQTR